MGPVWVLPEEPVPVRLMNTVWADRHGVHDALSTTADLVAWLDVVGMAPAGIGPAGYSVTDVDLAGYRRLRDALRRLAALLTEDLRPAAASTTSDVEQAVHEVNSAAAGGATPPRVRLHAGSLLRDDTPPNPALALGTLAVESIDLLTGETGARLRACAAPGCVLYFVKDHPRRAWCSTACGNRARAARHYRRHRHTATDPV